MPFNITNSIFRLSNYKPAIQSVGSYRFSMDISSQTGTTLGNDAANFGGSTYSYDATLTGSATLSSTVMKTGNGSLYLNNPDTTTQHLVIDTPISQGDVGTSISFWYRQISQRDNASIFDFGNGVANNNIQIQTISNNFKFNVYDAVGTLSSYTLSSYTIANNTWIHVVWTMNPTGNVSNIYINGVLQTSQTITYPESVERTNNYIGKSNDSANPCLNGYIDDFRFYKYIFTTDVINTIYKGDLKSRSLMFYVPFDSTPFQKILDSSSNGVNTVTYSALGSNVGTPTASLISPKYGLGSADVSSGWFYINQASTLTLSYPKTTGAGLTISIWAYMYSAVVGYRFLFNLSIYPSRIAIYYRPGLLGVSVNATPPVYDQTVTVSPVINTWYHICWVIGNTSSVNNTSKLFFNGVNTNITSSGTTVSLPPTTTTHIFGGEGISTTAARFQGKIDDFRIYNRALSDIEVGYLYNDDGPVPNISRIP